jgi:hypothetical protein
LGLLDHGHCLGLVSFLLEEMNSVVCTLFEGHYHLGAAALVNSLWASGFRGRVICGLRGEFPTWAEPSRSEASGAKVRDFGEGFEVWFVPCSTAVHFTNYKPTFMLEMWAEGAPAAAAERFYYFDPDIVVKCPWEVIERWAEDGIAVCEDVNFYLPPRHPLRIGWTHWLASQDIPVLNKQRERYYSGGFIGVPRERKDFLKLWETLIGKIGEVSGSLKKLKQGSANSLFHSMDQDAMNIAFMSSDVTINAAGLEAMDFSTGGHMLSHAIGSRKPWKGGFIKQAFNGYPPSRPVRAFFDHIDQPIQVFSPAESKRLRRSLRIASVIGRFHRRA